jgi:tetratricopeptide (TPR) repeat protein
VGLLLLGGQPAEARVEVAQLLAPEVPATARRIGRHEMVKVLAAEGRMAEALRVARQAPDGDGDPRLAHEHEPLSDLLAGSFDPQALDREVRAAREVDPTVVQSAALVAYGGDLALAAELATELDGPWRLVHDGVVAWRTGRTEEALALLRKAAAPRQGPRLLAEFLEGELLLESGHPREAADVLRRFLGRADWPYWPLWRSWAQQRARLLLARSLTAMGRTDEARTELDRLLRAWSSADPALPDLVAARALRSRLGEGAPG